MWQLFTSLTSSAASSEETGTIWQIRYPLEDGSGHVTVATTRPETMLGDVAVAVHPDDERYTILRTGRLLAPSMPVSSSTLPGLPPQPP